MKKKICLIIVVMILIMGGCTNKKENLPVTNTVSGITEDVTESTLVLMLNSGQKIETDISTTVIVGGEELLIGSRVTLTYTGELDYLNIVQFIKVEKINITGQLSPDEMIARRAQAIMTSMSLEEKVGQMFFVRYPGGTENEAFEAIKNYGFGGVILFAKDIRNRTKSQLKEMITQSQAASNKGIFVAIDEEGGTVVRISQYSSYRSIPFWSPQDLYRKGGFDLIISDAIEKASLLKSIGINVNLAPVADVSTDPSDYINARSFGDIAGKTAEYVKTIVDVMNNEGVGSVLKHFPGYGNNKDTHIGLAIDNRSYENFETSDFIPFIIGIMFGADSVMVSHNIIMSMDPDLPASLSLKVNRILRDELGFSGVIMTDELSMDAIRNYSYGKDPAVLAVLAGNDLITTTDFVTQIPNVISAVKNGEIKEDQINASVVRILIWKLRLGILK